jgi:Zn-dependent protease with chaperone function
MHSLLMLWVVASALGLRWQWRGIATSWNQRWNQALLAFCLPPLWLMAAAIAVLMMGHHGHMAGLPVSPLGCWLGLAILCPVVALVGYSLLRGMLAEWQMRRYPWVTLPGGARARLIESEQIFIAQMGIWNPGLIVSRRWIEELTIAEQQAVLHHEQAHYHFRDPFWFFWLGVVRRLTSCLPRTQALWAELLLLREIRADRRACQSADPLLLAELLVKLARQQPAQHGHPVLTVGFNDGTICNRLEQRIEALIDPDYLAIESPNRWDLLWLLSAVMPLMLIGLHG